MFGVEGPGGADLRREALHRRDGLEATVEDGLLETAEEVVEGDDGRGGGREEFARVAPPFLRRLVVAVGRLGLRFRLGL